MGNLWLFVKGGQSQFPNPMGGKTPDRLSDGAPPSLLGWGSIPDDIIPGFLALIKKGVKSPDVIVRISPSIPQRRAKTQRNQIGAKKPLKLGIKRNFFNSTLFLRPTFAMVSLHSYTLDI